MYEIMHVRLKAATDGQTSRNHINSDKKRFEQSHGVDGGYESLPTGHLAAIYFGLPAKIGAA